MDRRTDGSPDRKQISILDMCEAKEIYVRF